MISIMKCGLLLFLTRVYRNIFRYEKPNIRH